MASATMEPPTSSSASTESHVPRSVAAAGHTPSAPSAPTPHPTAPKRADEPLPELIEDFDAFISTTVKKYVKLSEGIGGAVAAQVGVQQF